MITESFGWYSIDIRDEVENALVSDFESKPKEFYKYDIHKLVYRWNDVPGIKWMLY